MYVIIQSILIILIIVGVDFILISILMSISNTSQGLIKRIDSGKFIYGLFPCLKNHLDYDGFKFFFFLQGLIMLVSNVYIIILFNQ
jgi:hypothetical protein